MKSVFRHTLRSPFQAEILSSLIFTLCFNVACIVRKSDGEYGERNYGRGLFIFGDFLRKVFSDVEAEVDTV